jgi:hypothetical protein
MSVVKVETAAFLPTIASAYAAVEGYVERLAERDEKEGSVPAVSITPVDALLVSLMATYHPGRPNMVDLASAATRGASTVLCRTIPGVRCVAVPRGEAHEWRAALSRYVLDLDQPLAEVLDLDNDEDAVRALTPSLVLTAPHPEAAAAFATTLQRWLGGGSGNVLLVLGVGETGACPLIKALTAQAVEPPWRVALLRERAPALAGSRLAVAAPRGDTATKESLFRIGQLFNDHFQYLDLVKCACLSALDRVPEDDLSLRVGEFGQHNEHTEPDSMRVLRRLLEERTRELHDLRNSRIVRLVTRVRRLVRSLAPPGSPQRWAALKVRAGTRRIFPSRRAGVRQGP